MASSTAPRVLLVAVLLTAVVVAAGAWAGFDPGRSGRLVAVGETSTVSVPPGPEVQAAVVLRAWDAARAEAWAAGDVRRLGTLYTPRSAAGQRDQAMLREWLRRGLVIRDLRFQVLALREVRRTARTWVLRVTDRVSAGSAVGRGAARPLPRDSASTTTVTLRWAGGRWLVESVRAAGS